MKKNLKNEYANQLIKNGIEPYSVVRHSYTNNRIEGKRPIDTVQSKDRNISPTLDTRCDCLGVAIEDVRLVGGFGNKCNNNTQYHEQNRVYDSECLATSIPANAAFHPNYTCESERERE